jgi:hypothetical protein
MPILNWIIPKKITIEATVVRWRQAKSSPALEESERVFLVEDAEGELMAVVCDLELSPDAVIADIGDKVTFSKYKNGDYAYKLKILATAAVKAA